VTVRRVTDEEVGVLARRLTPWGARRLAARFNAGPEHLRPVEYQVKRRGLRWAVIAYQAVVEDKEDTT
jgi:hypothetical protein